MYRVIYSLSLLFVIFCWAIPAAAETFRVSDNLVLEYRVPENWQATTTAPEFLVRQTVEHVSFHFRERGQPVPAALETKVRERMANTELFMVNPRTRAHLDIDFSPIGADEASPTRETVAKSARYAELELGNEEDLTDVSSRTEAYRLQGADYAYRIDATYKRDGEPRRFVGVVGFAGRYWVFLYYTDEAVLDADLQRLDEALKGLVLVTR